MMRQAIVVDPTLEKLVYCERCDFQEIYILENGIIGQLKVFDCPKCHNTFCPHCFEKPHENLSCEDYLKWKTENDNADKAFNEFLQKNAFRACPHCGANCEKVAGCNYMTCGSAECKRKKCFCYLCGIALVENQHFSHFLNNPYGPNCETLEAKNKEQT